MTRGIPQGNVSQDSSEYFVNIIHIRDVLRMEIIILNPIININWVSRFRSPIGTGAIFKM